MYGAGSPEISEYFFVGLKDGGAFMEQSAILKDLLVIYATICDHNVQENEQLTQNSIIGPW